MTEEKIPGEEIEKPPEGAAPVGTETESTSAAPDGSKGGPEEPLPELSPEEMKAENAQLKKDKETAEHDARGKLVDLQDERRRRQLAETNLADKNASSQADDVDPLEGISEDDETALTKGDLVKMNKAAKLNQNRQRDADLVVARDVIWDRSDKKAKVAHTAEIEGIGLDYATVADRAQQTLETKPHLKRAIIDSSDPAEDLYQLGLSHPDSRKAIKEIGAKDVTRKLLEKDPTVPTSPSSAGAKKGVGGKKDLSTMSAEEIALDPTITSDELIAHEEKRASGGK